jgi:hypothetical protein
MIAVGLPGATFWSTGTALQSVGAPGAQRSYLQRGTDQEQHEQ